MSASTDVASVVLVFLVITSFGYTLLAVASGATNARRLAYFAPAIGMAFSLVLSVYLVRWTGILFAGFSAMFCAAAAASLVLNVARYDLKLADLAALTGFSLIAALVCFLPVIRFGIYTPYGGDAMSFIAVSQRATTEFFGNKIEYPISWRYFPTAALVDAFKYTDTKLGAIFFASVVQRALSIQWSYEAFPIANALGISVATATTAGAIRLTSNDRFTWIAFLVGAALIITPNGFNWAASTGFFPSTIGVPLALALACLAWQFCLADADGQLRRPRFGETAIFGLLLSGLVFAYADVIAPLGASMVLSFLIFAAFAGNANLPANFGRALLILGGTLVGTAVIANTEIVKLGSGTNFVLNGLGHSIFSAPTAVGSPIPWSLWEFVSLAFGLRPWDEMQFFRDYGSEFHGLATKVDISLGVTAFAFLGTIAALLLSIGRRPRFAILIPAVFTLLLGAALIWFRYFVPSPWPIGTGHTFLQIRTATWAAAFCFVLIGAAIASTAHRWPKASPFLAALLVAWIVAGAAHTYNLAYTVTADFQKETVGGGFTALLEVRDAVEVAVPRNEPIFLDLPSDTTTAVFLKYVLSDRMLVGQWAEDAQDYGQLLCSARWRLGKARIANDGSIAMFADVTLEHHGPAACQGPVSASATALRLN